MALQLIYTSAPRLLQAGRTGFGTVAAHPGIPSWLIGEIERASQFSRVPGLDSTRVVLRHMIFGQGDRIHHVLSRIQDAGADYTGRTNHIAHHFVFTAAEAAKATTLGVTPVDALAFLESHKYWQNSWDGEPRPLGDDAILPVESIPKTITLPAETYWGALVPGRPECAAILAPGKTSEACWIVYPQGWGNAIVYAMGESLALHSNPWGVSFANDLQPTDNEQQIAWRGIPSGSPLLSKAQSSVRPCLDLKNPEALTLQPVPEFAAEARTGKKAQPKSRAAAPVFTKPLPETLRDPTPAIALLSKTTERPQRNPYTKPLAMIFGVLVLLLAVGGGFFGYQTYQNKQEVGKLKDEIASILPNSPSLEKIDLKEDLQSLKAFGDYLRKGEIHNAVEIHRGFPTGSPSWDEWRDFCKKEVSRLEDINLREHLGKIYVSAVDIPSESLAFQIKKLITKLNPTEQALWQNAIIAIEFLYKTDPKAVEVDMQLPSDGNNKYTSKRLTDKVSTLNAEIKRKAQEVSQKNVETPQPLSGDAQTYSINGTKYLAGAEKIDENKSIHLPPIYLVENNSKKLVFPPLRYPEPLKADKWFTTNLTVIWDQLPNDLPNSWNSKSVTSFLTEYHNFSAYFVIDHNHSEKPEIKFFVIEKDKLSKKIPNCLDIVEINHPKIIFKQEFINFINRIFKDKDDKYQILMELKFNESNYSDLDKVKVLFNDVIDIGDLRATLQEKKNIYDSDIEKQKSKITNLNNYIEKLKSELDTKFPFSEKEYDWNKFKSDIQKEIQALKRTKADIQAFERVFFTDGAKTVEVFLKSYSEYNEKDRFTTALSNMGEKTKKWFFFDAKEWSKESQDKFLEQFDRKKFNDIKIEIENSKKQIEAQNVTKERIELDRDHLKKLRSPQKATLNFYLEEADTEPFLTTEVTIPFPPDSAASPTPSTTP